MSAMNNIDAYRIFKGLRLRNLGYTLLVISAPLLLLAMYAFKIDSLWVLAILAPGLPFIIAGEAIISKALRSESKTERGSSERNG